MRVNRGLKHLEKIALLLLSLQTIPYVNESTESLYLTAQYTENVAWNLKWSGYEVNLEKYDCCPDYYPDVKFFLHFQRRSLFYAVNLMFPMGLITVLTILTFILPHESGDFGF